MVVFLSLVLDYVGSQENIHMGEAYYLRKENKGEEYRQQFSMPSG